jgi:hypothetical protein
MVREVATDRLHGPAHGVLHIIGLLPLVVFLDVVQFGTENLPLRHLPGLAPVVVNASGLRAPVVSDDWLEARVTAELRRANVPLLARSDALMDERQPLLVVRLQTVKVPDRRAFAWHLSLAVYQKMACVGDSVSRTLAQCWAAKPTLGITSTAGLKASVGESLDEQIAELGRAWETRKR